jgi:hypothetical protein
MNITYATLFPDLEGAAKQANIWPAYRVLFPEPEDAAPWPISSESKKKKGRRRPG